METKKRGKRNDENEGIRPELTLVVENIIMDTSYEKTLTCSHSNLSHLWQINDIDKRYTSLKSSDKE